MLSPDRLSTIDYHTLTDYRLLSDYRLLPQVRPGCGSGAFSRPGPVAGPAGLYPGSTGILPRVELWRASERLQEAVNDLGIQIPYERTKTALRASYDVIAVF